MRCYLRIFTNRSRCWPAISSLLLFSAFMLNLLNCVQTSHAHSLVCAMFASDTCYIGCLPPSMYTRTRSLSLPTSIQLDQLLFNMCYHSIVLHWYALAFHTSTKGVFAEEVYPLGTPVRLSSEEVSRHHNMSLLFPLYSRSVDHGFR